MNKEIHDLAVTDAVLDYIMTRHGGGSLDDFLAEMPKRHPDVTVAEINKRIGAAFFPHCEGKPGRIDPENIKDRCHYTRHEAAAILNKSVRCIGDMVRDGRLREHLRSTKRGDTYILGKDLKKYVNTNIGYADNIYFR